MELNLSPLSEMGNALFAILMPFIGPWLVHVGRGLARSLINILESNARDHDRFTANMLEVSSALRETTQGINELRLTAMRHESRLAEHERRIGRVESDIAECRGEQPVLH